MDASKVIIGSDHAGYRLKEQLKELLVEWGVAFEDVGTHSTESVDYPMYAEQVARRVAAGEGPGVLGVIVCGTGLGVSMAANKVAGVRAARCTEPYSARLAREHNDANVLCLGERVVGPGVAGDTLRAFLDGRFAGGRHVGRLEQMARIERGEK